MSNQFDELTKGLAQSVTRRSALKKFGVGIAGVVLATLGLAYEAEANPKMKSCLPLGALCGTNAKTCSRVCCSGRFYSQTGGPYHCL